MAQPSSSLMSRSGRRPCRTRCGAAPRSGGRRGTRRAWSAGTRRTSSPSDRLLRAGCGGLRVELPQRLDDQHSCCAVVRLRRRFGRAPPPRNLAEAPRVGTGPSSRATAGFSSCMTGYDRLLDGLHRVWTARPMGSIRFGGLDELVSASRFAAHPLRCHRHGHGQRHGPRTHRLTAAPAAGLPRNVHATSITRGVVAAAAGMGCSRAHHPRREISQRSST